MRPIALLLFSLSACSIDPSAVNDYSGLGANEIGKTLRSSIFLGESAVNFSVNELLKKNNIQVQKEPAKQLQSLGFNCHSEPSMYCDYEGSAKSAVSNPDRSQTIKIETFVNVKVLIVGNEVNVESKIHRKKY